MGSPLAGKWQMGGEGQWLQEDQVPVGRSDPDYLWRAIPIGVDDGDVM